MERQLTATSTNRVEEYATSFQSNNQQDHQMMYHHQLPPDHVSLHPYPKNTNKQPLIDSFQVDQNYPSHLQAVDDLSETSTLNIYSNLRASSALAHHQHHQHYQQQQEQQQQPQLQSQLLISQQDSRQQPPQQQQHRHQLSPSQYPPHNYRSLAVANQPHQHMQPQQQQQHSVAYTQSVDSQSYYVNQQNNYPYLMDEVDNSLDYRVDPMPDQNQTTLYDQNMQQQQQQPVVVASHLYSTSSEQTKHNVQVEERLLVGSQQSLMSVNYTDRNSQEPQTHMSSQTFTTYADDQIRTQTSMRPIAAPTLNQQHQVSQQDVPVLANQSQYITTISRKPELDLEGPPSSSSDNTESMLNHQYYQKHTVNDQYSAPMRQSQVLSTNGTSQMRVLGQPAAPVNQFMQSSQLQRSQNNFTNNLNPIYETRVMQVNYESESHVKNSQNYVPTIKQRNTNGGNIVFHHRPQHQQQQQQQQQNQSQTVQFVDSQAHYDPGRITLNNTDGLQQQQRIPQVVSNNSQTNINRALVNRPIDRKQDDFVDLRSNGSVSQDWLDTICKHLIDHMNRFGICVIDNFLGPLKGDQIFKEVLQLYSSGQHTRGGLVNSNKLSSRSLGADAGVIRNDRVIWIDGYEEGCSEINNLIQTLCSVITNSSRLSLYSNNGLDKIVINKRTKAHVACYPGNGTRYIKHVDNPNGDGRVITAIYYLNKNWNTKQDGGLLRMFPTGINEVANIEPLFDRVLFFWSDRRNPHEVLPAYRDRFAITVWYIGENRA